MTIESLIAEANEDGWLVNQLVQLDDKWWRANFRRRVDRDPEFTEVGLGATPEAALAAALEAKATGRRVGGPEMPAVEKPASDSAETVEDLLS